MTKKKSEASESPLTRNELVARISAHKNVRQDLVREVIEGLIDVATEEIVNRGTFVLRELVLFESKPWGGYKMGDGVEVPQHKRLVVKVPQSLRVLFKLNSKSHGQADITKDNWRKILKYARSNPAESNRGEVPSSKADSITQQLLSDDEDE